MKTVSCKQRARIRQAAPIRHQLIVEAGRCMICHHRPGDPPPGFDVLPLCCHEIARGPHRSKALDKPYAILVLCMACHVKVDDLAVWPQARQLAVLQRASPHRYDLAAFNRLVNPNAPYRITQEEVDYYHEGGRHVHESLRHVV